MGQTTGKKFKFSARRLFKVVFLKSVSIKKKQGLKESNKV